MARSILTVKTSGNWSAASDHWKQSLEVRSSWVLSILQNNLLHISSYIKIYGIFMQIWRHSRGSIAEWSKALQFRELINKNARSFLSLHKKFKMLIFAALATFFCRKPVTINLINLGRFNSWSAEGVNPPSPLASHSLYPFTFSAPSMRTTLEFHILFSGTH